MPRPVKTPFDPGYVALIDALIVRRRSLGWTQTDLASAYGEDQSFISRVERKQRRIDVWEFVRLCRALGLKPSEILDQA